MIEVNTVVKIAGSRYVADIGRVTEQWIGIEDHGFLTLELTFDLGHGSIQGLGHRILGTTNETSEEYEEINGFFIFEMLNVFGVREWSKIVGQRVYVLYEDGQYHGRIVGLASLDGNRHFIMG